MARLTPETEEDWRALCELCDFADSFALVFVFADDAFPARLLRQRLVEHAARESWTLRTVVAADDTPPADALITLLGQPDEHAIVWFEAMGSTTSRVEWWTEVALRLNERREVLRRGVARVLCLVAPPAAKAWIREAASDLWSITTLMLAARVVPPALPDLPLPLALPTEAPAAASPARQSVAAQAIRQALRLPPGRRRRAALLDAAEAAIGAGIGDVRLANALVAEFRRAPRGNDSQAALHEMIALRRAAHCLNRLERPADALRLARASIGLAERWGRGDVNAFRWEHALSLDEVITSLDMMDRRDEALGAALQRYTFSTQIAQLSPLNEARYAFSQMSLARRLVERGQLTAAESLARDAVVIARGLSSSDVGIVTSLRQATLDVLAYVLVALGRFAEGSEVLDEALGLLRSPPIQSGPMSRAHLGTKLISAGHLLMTLGRPQDAVTAGEEGWAMVREALHTQPDASMLGACAAAAVLYSAILVAAERPSDALSHYTATIDDLLPSLASHPARITGGVITLRDAAAALAEAQPDPPSALLDAIRRLDELRTSAADP